MSPLAVSQSPPVAASPARNFAWSLGGRAFRVIVSIGVGAWVARYLGPARYGELASVQATVMMLLAFVGLGLDSLIRQQLVRESPASDALLGTCMQLRLIVGTLAYVALAIVAWHDPAARAIWLVLGSMLITHVPLSIDFWFQARGQLHHSALAQNLAFAVASALRVALIAARAPLVGFALLIVLEGPLTAAYLFVVYRRHRPGQFTFEAAIAREWLRRCWPLFAASVVTTAFARLDQSVLLVLAGPAEAGRFAAATRVFDLLVFVPVAMVTSLLPGIAGAASAGSHAFESTARRAFEIVTGAGWLLAVAMAAAAGGISRYLFGAAFAGTEVVLRVLAIAVLLHGSGLVRSEAWIAAGWARRLLAATVVGVLANAALACWWIPCAGAAGAAWATVCSMLIGQVAMNIAWRDTRRFALWQLQALAGSVWWRRKNPVAP